ncbi:hypothetical protein [Flavobacterium limi]|uniref:Uncharacterized protein n=1 Tax=Flavobacterium limi TaxID=2045105 RepID=A0ABQ1U4W2_9FLAO|nr:hypothetical protein [Flavobacterium limi]GGF10385.1 hypothetical protein GCM10011518_19470 [Flavobacterium limi]
MKSKELLNIILKLFKSHRNNSEIIKELLNREIINFSFEKKYVLNNVDFDFELVKTISKNKDLIEYYVEASDGSPYKIELIFDQKWLLKSFLFQCQGCFGNDDECLVCGGSGWGVL